MAKRWIQVAAAVAMLASVTVASPDQTAAQSGGLPPDFVDSLIVSGLELPTAMTFLPDGRMLVGLKEGEIVIIEDPADPQTGTASYMTIVDINAGDDERGVMNLVVDPDFAVNGHFYVYYSQETSLRFQVSRFTHIENAGGLTSRGDLSSEVTIWADNEPFIFACCHFGGGLTFAPDGTLLLSTGEEFDAAQSTDLTRAGGKLHRFNTDGTIPATNPLHDGSPGATNALGQLQSIIAYGLRNPFRASFDVAGDRVIIGEVGGNNNNFSLEDIHTYPFDETNPPLVDMGWPGCEGACFTDPDPGNPLWSYPHAGSGASVTGGVVYTGDMFPAEYQGSYFFGDWVRKEISYLTIDETDPARPATAETLFLDTTDRPQDFAQGPDGALYYLATDNDFGGGNVFLFQGEIRRISYNAGNAAPTCAPTATPDSGATAPLSVDFAAGADDADGDPLTFTWDFGDGSPTSNAADPTHEYTELGTYDATLFVSDGTATTACDSLTVQVGDAPTVVITSPPDGTLFRAGDVIDVTATATDAGGTPLPASDVMMSAVFVHNEHSHPALSPTPGGFAQITVPSDGHDYSSNTGYQVFASATDGSGLTTVVSIDLVPDKVDMSLSVSPAAVAATPLRLDDLPLAMPAVHDTLIDFEHTLDADVLVCVGGVEYGFVRWLVDGVEVSSSARLDVTVPVVDVDVVAEYSVVGSCQEVQGALSLDGQSGMTIPAVTLPGDFTIESWVRFTAGESITVGDGLVRSGDATQDINFYQGRLRVHDRNVGWDHIAADTTMVAGEWHHVAVVREGGFLAVYIDGVLDRQGTLSYTNAFSITRVGSAIYGALDGELDETRIWNVARSASELADNHAVTVDPASPGLVAYFGYDSLDGGVPDLAGGDNDGVLGDGGSIVTSTAPVVSTGSNSAPVISAPLVDQAFGVGDDVSVQVVAADGDGDVLAYSAVGLAPGLGIDAVSGLITGQPTIAGVFSSDLIVSDGNGGTDQITIDWTITGGPANNAPTCAVTLTYDNGAPAPLSVDFAAGADDADGDPLTFLWDFGDGSPTSTEENPTHVYDDAGTYEVTLSVSDGTATTVCDPASVQVDPAPTVELSMSVAPGAVASTPLDFDGSPLAMPAVSDVTVGAVHGLDADVLVCVGGVEYGFVRWLVDGVEVSSSARLDVTVPVVDVDVVAEYSVVGSCQEVQGALSLDGQSGMTIPAVTLPGDFTIESWVRFTAGESITVGDGLVRSGDATQDINFYQGRLRVHDRNVGWDHIAADTTMVAGEWHHVAVVREGGFLAVYIDGVLDRQGTLSYTNAFSITRVGSAIYGALDGELDETRIWNVARSASELADNHAVTVDPASPGLVAYFGYDSLDGGVPDLAGGDNDGVLGDGGSIVTSTAPVVSTGSNSAPVISAPLVDQAFGVGDDVSVQVVAADGDGDVLAYSAVGLAPGLGIDAVSGLITGQPTIAGVFSSDLIVSDGNGGTDQITIDWTITEDLVMANPGAAAVAEGDTGTVFVDVPLTLSAATSQDVTVDWTTFASEGPGFATAGVDFVAASGQLTIPAGETVGYVSVEVIGDLDVEPPLLWGEWAFVLFSNASANAELNVSFFGLGVAVIVDDDTP